MAPLPDSSLKAYLTTLLKRTPSPSPLPNLLERTAALLPRATTLTDPSAGVTPFDTIPNKAIFIIFGLIGLGIVCTGIWFFFWAKNGGFYFKENDWDDYKSTVLRRKGPNGTTLSGATESTDLGGGSVVHGEKRSIWGKGRRKKGEKRYKDFDEDTEYTGSAGGSSLGSEMSEMKRKARKEKKKDKKSRLRGGDLVAESLMDDNETVVSESVRDELRAYRHEKPARVGGLNKQPDGSAWDGSTNDNSTAADDLLSHREHTPTSTPTKVKKERKDTYTGGTGGIRKVVSTSGGGSSFWNRSSNAKKEAEEERIKAEAKKLQDKGRAAQRRDFSFNVGDDSTVASEQEERQARREAREARRASRSPTKKVPGSYIYEGSEVGSAVSSDVGIKSYHHPIPGLSSTAGSEYAEDRRKKRNGGYRRGRRDSLSDDGN